MYDRLKRELSNKPKSSTADEVTKERNARRHNEPTMSLAAWSSARVVSHFTDIGAVQFAKQCKRDGLDGTRLLHWSDEGEFVGVV